VKKKEISDSNINLSIDEDQNLSIENLLSDKNSTFIVNEDLINF
jgi:hypothetical protein